ncbi:MAG: Electron transfer flavoprotein, alpha subunit [Deltaproteobacteria bacterium]|jgi:electron transfer flavoprotein alpha subunit|nr:Electron transfer flavoprotein, alpha subunit [Deltaproteobacteria bacterium]
MSYLLVVAEVRRGVFEERNLDSIGLGRLMQKPVRLLVPEKTNGFDGRMVDSVLRVGGDEEQFLNPLAMVAILAKIFESQGKPDFIAFTHSSSGAECAAYVSGHFAMPVITDVSGFDAGSGTFLKSYYSDKVFARISAGSSPAVVTVRSGSFKEHVTQSPQEAVAQSVGDFSALEGRSFVEYVEEAAGGVDITKAEFLLSVGRGIGNKDEVARYEELAQSMRAVLSCSRPVVDKLWVAKERQVGTSGKTVKPKVYLAMGISGAFQHIAGMKDSDCIIAINKDPEAPIFQYAHFGVVADANKLRDKLLETVKGS